MRDVRKAKTVRRRLFITAALLAATAGCAPVPPAPVNLPARSAARVATQLEEPKLRQIAQGIAPAAPHMADSLDRLDLFAAILAQDPRVAEARAAVLSAQRDARAAHKVAAPTFTLSSEYANDPSTSSPWLLGGAVNLPLDIGGRRSARLAKADLAVLVARQDLAEMVWSERVALQRGLIDAMAGAEQVRLGTGILALRDRQLAVLEDRARRGEIASLDLYPYRAARAAALRTLNDARARAAGGRAAVAGVLGVPVSALDGKALLWNDFTAPQANLPALSAAERARAIAARADVLRALASYDQAEADLRAQVAQRYPAISLGPGYTWERGLVKLPFALNLSLPSWDLNRAAIAAAEAHRAQAGATIETTLANAQAAIEAAQTERLAAEAALARLRGEELPATARAADKANLQLKLGAIGTADWTAAQIAAQEAQLAQVDALTRVRAANLALEDALRRPLDGPETMIDPALVQPWL
ncbi:CRISPR system Cascade subunit CasA [Novosphingobium sp. GV055]|nr:CRISPR system Cascade subunit CasA [Novosphingobium sp. GV055]PUB07554.1 CRISPR system Cascade subunit CasA [Novosphingobium sp. GV061]PUB23367.1 CRISPR system Cascade subunit CasA [Novosphingobium sp. GV079]PUB45131.1 CRISPR system Cascade subunit CasA [Novosphingobium sp. GV027]